MMRSHAGGFEIAQERRGRLCSVDKANVLDVSQLWRDRVDAMAPAYANVDVSLTSSRGDALVRDPRQFVSAHDLFGDILSDEAAEVRSACSHRHLWAAMGRGCLSRCTAQRRISLDRTRRIPWRWSCLRR